MQQGQSINAGSWLYGGTACFALGIYLGLQQLAAYNWCLPYIWCAAATMAVLALTQQSARRLLVPALVCFLLAGIGSGLRVYPSAAQQLAPYAGRQVQVLGAVEPASVYFHDGYGGFVVRCAKLQLQGKTLAYSGRLRVSLRTDTVPASGTVCVTGTLEQLTSLRNPGGFDASTYNRVNNLGGRLRQAEVYTADESVLWWQQLELWNLALCRQLEQKMGAERGGLLSGMLLGGSGKLDEDTRELFAANGLAHLLSVSGTHLVMLTGLLLSLFAPLPLLWRKRVVSVLLILYALLCGLRPPVLRALVMSLVLLWGGRGAERGRLLCLAFLAMLCWRPLWLLDIGFQLSFGAAAGLLWLLPCCKRLVPACLPDMLAEALAVTLAAQLAVLPLEVVYFHQISLISLVSNLLLVPLLELSAQLALLGCRLPGGGLLLQLADFVLRQVLQQAGWLLQLPFARVTIGSMPVWTVLIYYAFLAVLADFAWLQFLANRERILTLALLACTLAGVYFYQCWRTLPLTVYFLDVGQGDCAVVVTPQQRVVVIDTGGLKNLATGSRVVAPFLRSLGYSKIDVLLLSHYDFDHVGGAPSLLKQVPAELLLLPAEELTEESAKLQAEILRLAFTSQKKQVRQGEVLQLDAGTQLVLADVPQQAVRGNEASTLAAVCSAYGSVLFTGDMGEEREQQLQLAQQYTVLKAGHHGSRHSSSADFLLAVRPKLTVISCGQYNRYGHPHAEVLQRLQEAGSSIVRTDEAGCIKVVFTAEGIRCYSYADFSWHWLQ